MWTSIHTECTAASICPKAAAVYVITIMTTVPSITCTCTRKELYTECATAVYVTPTLIVKALCDGQRPPTACACGRYSIQDAQLPVYTTKQLPYMSPRDHSGSPLLSCASWQRYPQTAQLQVFTARRKLYMSPMFLWRHIHLAYVLNIYVYIKREINKCIYIYIYICILAYESSAHSTEPQCELSWFV